MRAQSRLTDRRLAGALCVSALALALSGGSAVAKTLTAACSGKTGSAASLAAQIKSANSHAGPDTVALGHGCTYTLTKPDNNWYGPNGLPPIASDITLEGNGSAIFRNGSGPAAELPLLLRRRRPRAHGNEELRLPRRGPPHPPQRDTQRWPGPGRQLRLWWRWRGHGRRDLQPGDRRDRAQLASRQLRLRRGGHDGLGRVGRGRDRDQRRFRRQQRLRRRRRCRQHDRRLRRRWGRVPHH